MNEAIQCRVNPTQGIGRIKSLRPNGSVARSQELFYIPKMKIAYMAFRFKHPVGMLAKRETARRKCQAWRYGAGLFLFLEKDRG